MADTYWILAPVRVQSKDGSPTEIAPEFETIQRAFKGFNFESAESAMTWLELIGYPEEELGFQCLANKESEKE